MLQHRLALSAFMLLPLHVLILFSKPHQVVLFCEVSGHLALPTYSLLAQPSAPPSVSVRLSGILFLLPRPLLEFPLNRLHWGTNWVCLKTFFFCLRFPDLLLERAPRSQHSGGVAAGARRLGTCTATELQAARVASTPGAFSALAVE